MFSRIMRGTQFISVLPQTHGMATAGVVRISFESAMVQENTTL